MHQVQVNVTPRKPGKKADLKLLRTKGLVPANIYGPGVKTEPCALSEKELRSAFKNDLDANLIIELQSSESTLKGKKVILKNISRSPMWNVEHVDLYEISMNRPLTVRVPIHITGVPDGVKNEGGILQLIRRFFQVKALPNDLPDFIEVDVSAMKLNETLHVGEVKVSDKVKVLDNPKFAVVAVTEPEKEEVVAPVAAAEGAAAPAGEGAAAAPSTGAPAAAGAAAPAAGAAAGAKAAPAKDDKKK